MFALILTLKDEGSLTAEEFFDVDRSLLVSLTGTLLTYIIILIGN